MIRAALIMLASIFVISVVKLILSTMGRMFQEATQESATSTTATGAGTSPPGGKSKELKKCAVCGTYAPVQSAPKVKGMDAFICSDACAAQWRG